MFRNKQRLLMDHGALASQAGGGTFASQALAGLSIITAILHITTVDDVLLLPLRYRLL